MSMLQHNRGYLVNCNLTTEVIYQISVQSIEN